MALKHPYIGVVGAIAPMVAQLRKQFPATVDASTLKKYDLAPNNESYLINILKFIGVLDDKGDKSDTGKAVFLLHDDSEFQPRFGELVQTAYSKLFELYGTEAWTLPVDKLISFFRQNDETSDVIGNRQARTFATLATIAGMRDVPANAPKKAANSAKASAAPKSKPAKKISEKVAEKKIEAASFVHPPSVTPGVAALTVRIEVNLPAGCDKETYDFIFKSIRENLMQ